MAPEDETHSEKTGLPSYTIEQVATQTGLTRRTLRYYEEMGLLPPTGRTEGNYRRYCQEDLQRLERIKNLRDLLGFSLADIRTILEAEDERQQIKVAYCQETDVTTKIAQLEHSSRIIHSQLKLIEQKITGLEQMRAELLARLEKHKQMLAHLQEAGDAQ